MLAELSKSTAFTSSRHRLNTIQFLALRSIAKEPWDLKWGRIRWRFQGKWVHLFRSDGVRAPLGSIDGTGGRYGYDEVIKRAWDAAYELETMGFVELLTVRCCPGSLCHANDRREFRLSRRGDSLLQKANAAPARFAAAQMQVPRHTVIDDVASRQWWRVAASWVLLTK
ncbi:hypothetical protein [Achromobacter anxifer]|uniref:hypothetical protein n=1 Tax=Achromobacter anxifer TaxID=1287737 RepID=UPI0023F9C9C1|nr:hypothetical protein [Achromobacter anxifer]MDF8364691.1 hypothetical protein [Achromobacter anxifer]